MKDKAKRDAATVRCKKAIADLGVAITAQPFVANLDGAKVVDALCNVQGTHPDVIPEFVAAYNDYVAEELEYDKC